MPSPLKPALRQAIRNFKPNGRRYHELTRDERLAYLAAATRTSRSDIEALLEKKENHILRGHIFRTSPLEIPVRKERSRIKLASQPF